MTTEEIVEDRWDCTSCQTKDILGRHMNCTNCGNAKDPGEAYKTGDSKPVTDPELLKLANAGANWTCEFCGQDNRNGNHACAHDGAPKEVKRSMAQREAEHEQELLNFRLPPSTSVPGSNVALPLVVVSVGGLFLFGFMALWLLLSPSTVKATLQNAQWTSTIRIDQQVEVENETWDSAPAGTRLISQVIIPDGGGYQTRVVGQRPSLRTWTEKVQDGYDKFLVDKTVPDGYDTVYVDQQVPDGYSYTYEDKQVRDGTRTVYKDKRVQTGTKKVEVGRESLGNGFSKVKYDTVPVYGTKSVAEQVPNYKTVRVEHKTQKYKTIHVPERRPRTRIIQVAEFKPRMVDIQRSEPILIPIEQRFPIPRTKVRYGTMTWQDNGHPEMASGNDLSPRWPNVNLKPNEKENSRTESFNLEFVGPQRYAYHPGSAAEFGRFHIGKTYRVKVSGNNVTEFEER